LFKKLWPKLLKSYAIDALNAADEEAASKQCSRNDATAFLQETAKAGTKKSDTKKGITSTKRESDKVLLFSAHELRDKRRAEASSGLGAGWEAEDSEAQFIVLGLQSEPLSEIWLAS